MRRVGSSHVRGNFSAGPSFTVKSRSKKAPKGLLPGVPAPCCWDPAVFRRGAENSRSPICPESGQSILACFEDAQIRWGVRRPKICRSSPTNLNKVS